MSTATDTARPFELKRFLAEQMREVDAWLEQFRGFWQQRLDALGTEIARGRRRSR